MTSTPESIVRRLIEKGFNEGDLEVVDAITSPGLVEHQNFGPATLRGPRGCAPWSSRCAARSPTSG